MDRAEFIWVGIGQAFQIELADSIQPLRRFIWALHPEAAAAHIRGHVHWKKLLAAGKPQYRLKATEQRQITLLVAHRAAPGAGGERWGRTRRSVGAIWEKRRGVRPCC